MMIVHLGCISTRMVTLSSDNNEIWKSIVGLNGLYEASNYGRIRSVDRIDSMGRVRKGRILSPANKDNGYLYFTASYDGSRKNVYVHRAVFSAFNGIPVNEIDEIDHVNCNKKDNRIDNLEQVDGGENIRRASENGLLINKNRPLEGDVVLAIYQDHRSQSVIAKTYGVTQRCVCDIKMGKTYKDITGGKPNSDPRGKNSPLSLSEDVVRKIQRDSRSAKTVSLEFGCSVRQVYRIREGVSYSWVR